MNTAEPIKAAREQLSEMLDTFAKRPDHLNKQAILNHIALSASAEQQPDLYQYRMKREDQRFWSGWTDCSPEAYADYVKTPVLHGWQYEVRTLYSAPQASQPSAWNETLNYQASDPFRIWWEENYRKLSGHSAYSKCAATWNAALRQQAPAQTVFDKVILPESAQQAPAVQEEGLLSEIRALAECGVSHGLLADDYCSQIVAKIDGASNPATAQTGEKTK